MHACLLLIFSYMPSRGTRVYECTKVLLYFKMVPLGHTTGPETRLGGQTSRGVVTKIQEICIQSFDAGRICTIQRGADVTQFHSC
jgi:hypothetical protein